MLTDETAHRLSTLMAQHRMLGISEQPGYDKLEIAKVVWDSMSLSGGSLSKQEIDDLFGPGTVSGKHSMRELLQAWDLRNAYQLCRTYVERRMGFAIEGHQRICACLMRNTGRLFESPAGIVDSAKGDFRLNEFSTHGMTYSAANLTARVADYCDAVNRQRKELRRLDTVGHYLNSFTQHYLLATIRPFAEGNLRMARLLMQGMQYEAYLLPTVIRQGRASAYMETLDAALKSGDPQPFLDFMVEETIANIEGEINLWKAER